MQISLFVCLLLLFSGISCQNREERPRMPPNITERAGPPPEELSQTPEELYNNPNFRQKLQKT